MDLFDDLFGKRHHPARKRVRHHDDAFGDESRHHENHRGREDRHESHRTGGATFAIGHPLVRQLMQNKTAIVLLGLLVLVAIVVIGAALAYLLPVLAQLLGTIEDKGIKGLFDQATHILGKFWLGSGN